MDKFAISLQEAIKLREDLQSEGKTLVFTNGVFDLLHVGHLDYLEKARALGAALLVGLNDDESVRAYKGAGQPVVPVEDRARLLAALRPVTAVIIFSELTADNLLLAIKPQIYAKGGDYAHKVLPERPTVESYGGEIRLIDYLPERSTSQLVAKIKTLPDI